MTPKLPKEHKPEDMLLRLLRVAKILGSSQAKPIDNKATKPVRRIDEKHKPDFVM